MTAKSSRGPRVPITALAPQTARLRRQLEQSLRPFPDWTAVVPDANLRRYLGRARVSQGNRTLLYYMANYPDDPAIDNISDYLPTDPLIHLEVMHHYLCEDESRTVVVQPSTVRGKIIENLVAAIATTLDTTVDDTAIALPTRFARAACGCAGVAAPGESRIVSIDGPPEQAMDAAWHRIFGATMRELEMQFRRSYPDLARADASRRRLPWLDIVWHKHGRLPTNKEREEIAAAHGYVRWEGDPYHFLNWVWAEHRRLARNDFAPYGLDANHWELLVPSATSEAGR